MRLVAACARKLAMQMRPVRSDATTHDTIENGALGNAGGRGHAAIRGRNRTRGPAASRPLWCSLNCTYMPIYAIRGTKFALTAQNGMEDELSGRALDALRRRASLPTAAGTRPAPSGPADSSPRIADIEQGSQPPPARNQRKMRVSIGRHVVSGNEAVSRRSCHLERSIQSCSPRPKYS